MDNLTHTLIGVLAGETAARTTSASINGLPPQQRRNLFVTAMAVGSNLPDLDFVYPAITGNKLDYLLQHRGHTHTLVGALVIAALLFLACDLWCRWRKWTVSRRDRLHLASIAALALLLHIAMDFTNSYGVHPFWPFYNGWLYGDSVFIWEPLLWSAAAPLVFILRTRVARTAVAILLAVAIAAIFLSGLVSIMFVALLTLLTISMLVVGRCAVPRTALIAGIAVWFGVTAAFATSGAIADRQIKAFVLREFPGMNTLDRALTPLPANPVCWDVMLALADGDRYLIRHATWSLAPRWIPAQQCMQRDLFRSITAPISPMAEANTDTVLWHGEVIMTRAQIAALAAANCEVAAFMRFARMPWILQRDGRTVIGDLRYDREPGLGFAEIELGEKSGGCPALIPPWVPPRQELLQGVRKISTGITGHTG